MAFLPPRGGPVSTPPPPRIDLNADLGESFGTWVLGDDAEMLRLVTSANVACGFHAGDPTTLRRTCAEAVARGVVIGAQVGYRDLAGFGRRYIAMAPEDLEADVLYQIGALDGLARVAGDRVRYVKPHGALYNAIVHDEEQAAAVVAAVRAYDADLPVLGLPGSAVLRQAAEAGLRTVPEAFADRAYTPSGTLVSRREPGAVLHDPQQVAERVVRLVTTGQVVAVDGSVVDVGAATVCVHGDSPGAVAMARAVRDGLAGAGVTVAPFAGAGAGAA
jgi:5-oxoprolinase (ATP-hydrolysing) subunit A